MQASFVGRVRELEALSREIEAARSGRGRVALISGEPGIGKSALVGELVSRAVEDGFQCLVGRCGPVPEPYSLFSSAIEKDDWDRLLAPQKTVTVDEVFLVWRSGLLISHLVTDKSQAIDGDIVAGMLTAVGDFVKDSLMDKAEKTGLGKLEYRDTKIFIEHGASIFVVAITKGSEPQDLRGDLREVLDSVNTEYGGVLEKWNGDLEKVKGVEKHLAGLLGKEYRVMEEMSRERVEQERVRISEGVLEYLQAASEETPLLISLEDVHWADEASLNMVEHIARGVGQSKVMMCLSYRPGFLGKDYADAMERLGGLDTATKLELGPVEPSTLKQMIRDSLGECDDGLLKGLMAGSRGNPLFVSELIRLLRLERAIERTDEGWRLKKGKIDIPSSLSDSMERHLYHLAPEELYVVEGLAILGQEPTASLVETFFDEMNISLHPILAELESKGLVERRGRAWAFSNSLLRSAVRDGMSERWKRSRHYKAGLALEEEHKDDRRVVLYRLANHFYKAGNVDKGVHYSMMAGDDSMALDLSEALRHYNNAWVLIRNEPWDATSLDIRKLILKSLADIYCTVGEYDLSMERYAELMSIGNQIGDRSLVATVLLGIGNIYYDKGEFTEAKKNASYALDLFMELKDEVGVAKAHVLLGRILCMLGDMEDAIAQYGRALEKLPETEEWLVIGDAYVSLGNVHIMKGDYGAARMYYMQAIQIFDAHGLAYRSVNALNNIGESHRLDGECEQAIPFYEQCVELSRKFKIFPMIGYGLEGLASCYVTGGNLEKASRCCDEGLEIFERLDDQYMMAGIHETYGRIHRELGDLEEAGQHLVKSIEFTRKQNVPFYLGKYLLEYGKLQEEMGDVEGARGSLAESLGIFRKLNNKEMVEQVTAEMERLG